jgi:hypothetical protein
MSCTPVRSDNDKCDKEPYFEAATVAIAYCHLQHGDMLLDDELKQTFDPVFADIRGRATVADNFIDRNLYRVYIATLWSNVVLSPEEVGIEEDDLEVLHDLVLAEMRDAIGSSESMKDLYQFISSKDGEKAMQEAHITQTHKDLLNYFASMILDPEGHKRWMDHIRDKQP